MEGNVQWPLGSKKSYLLKNAKATRVSYAETDLNRPKETKPCETQKLYDCFRSACNAWVDRQGFCSSFLLRDLKPWTTQERWKAGRPAKSGGGGSSRVTERRNWVITITMILAILTFQRLHQNPPLHTTIEFQRISLFIIYRNEILEAALYSFHVSANNKLPLEHR